MKSIIFGFVAGFFGGMVYSRVEDKMEVLSNKRFVLKITTIDAASQVQTIEYLTATGGLSTDISDAIILTNKDVKQLQSTPLYVSFEAEEVAPANIAMLSY